jgi:arsenate reductase
MAKKTEKLVMWHKTNCAKSCEVMKALKEEHVLPETFLYLVTPPSADDIKSVLQKLGMKAEELVRKKEPVYKENYAGKKMTEAQWIKALVKHPVLIERPILIKGDKAIIGRPTERIYEFINSK